MSYTGRFSVIPEYVESTQPQIAFLGDRRCLSDVGLTNNTLGQPRDSCRKDDQG
jgi:hypothetical protein